jgi:hypothetical protein
MTYEEAAKILDDMPELKGLHHAQAYIETTYQDGHKESGCDIYVVEHGHFEAETWDTVLALINKEFRPSLDTEGRPKRPILPAQGKITPGTEKENHGYKQR